MPNQPARRSCACLYALVLCFSGSVFAQQQSITPAPDRAEGEGPFSRMILRGVTVIAGTGAPPVGPVDIVIEGNRIADIRSVGNPGAPIDPEGRPQAEDGDKVLELAGSYVLPGFIDMHGHIGGVEQGTPAEYVLKLWMGHGITTVRDPGSGNGLDWVLEHKKRSAENTITSPRLEAYAWFGAGADEAITTPQQARQWMAGVARRGGDGVKLYSASPAVLEAALDEAGKRGLRTAMHHAQLAVLQANVLDTARWGLTTMEHWYGLPEALFTRRQIQNYPLDYNYNNEQHRFGEAGKLWKQAAAPGSEHWNAVRDELISLDFTLDPTLTIYEASRDLMAARRAEWHEDYTLPALWDFYAPNRNAHGSYWFSWSTQHEVAWRENYKLWMQFINDYKNHGGRVTAGSDSGFIYKLYGFGYIEELELLQEAGFHPLEVIQAATLNGAQALGLADQLGSIEIGKLADMVVVDANPLADFKVLYGTGAIRVTNQNEVKRVGGVRLTIKDGIVYDAKALLADVRTMVQEAKDEAGRPALLQPGIPQR